VTPSYKTVSKTPPVLEETHACVAFLLFLLALTSVFRPVFSFSSSKNRLQSIKVHLHFHSFDPVHTNSALDSALLAPFCPPHLTPNNPLFLMILLLLVLLFLRCLLDQAAQERTGQTKPSLSSCSDWVGRLEDSFIDMQTLW